MKKIISIALFTSLFLIASCSTGGYLRPAISQQLYKQQVPGDAVVIFNLAKMILPAVGYGVLSSDAQSKYISTKPVQMTIDSGDCDCGTVMGLPVIKSKPVKADVTFNIGVASNELTISADIVPDLSDGGLGILLAGANVACVSKGKLEETLAKSMVNSMKDKLKIKLPFGL